MGTVEGYDLGPKILIKNRRSTRNPKWESASKNERSTRHARMSTLIITSSLMLVTLGLMQLERSKVQEVSDSGQKV